MSLFDRFKDRNDAPKQGPAAPGAPPASGRATEPRAATSPPSRGEAPAGRSEGSGRAEQSSGDRRSPTGDTQSPKRDTRVSPTKGGAVATIGKSIIFKGELTGDEDLEIDGVVEGDVKLPNHVLKIGANGKVKASVVAKCVQVVGRIAGDVNATERVEVEATGVVEGDIHAPRLLVQEGAVINGAIEMTKTPVAAGTKPGDARPTATPGEASRKVG